MTDDTRELIEEARRFDTVPAEYAVRLLGSHSLIRRLADALEASLPTEDDARALERVIYEAWNMERGDVIPWIGEAGRLKLAHAIFEHFRRSPVPPEPTPDEWRSLIRAERARQIEKGYTIEHDREYGPNHLIGWTIDYARRGKTVEVASMMLALADLLAASPPVNLWKRSKPVLCAHCQCFGYHAIGCPTTTGSVEPPRTVPPETDETYMAWAAQEANREQARVFVTGLEGDFPSGWRDGFEAGLLHRALAAVPPVTEEPDLPNGHAPVEQLPGFLARRVVPPVPEGDKR